MSQSAAAAPNADQIAFWNAVAGDTWAEMQALLDRQIEPIGRRAIEALSPAPGERLLDIGCGCGQSTIALSREVAAQGLVTGCDISRRMLQVAKDRVAAAGVANVRFVEADAQVHPFEPGAADAAHSRFGVMFFQDPQAAFANIRRGLKPGGRLAFVCWRGLAENPWMTEPLAAALRHLPAPAPPAPGAPGPFAFADPERVRSILAGAGFQKITVAPLDTEVGGNSLEDSLRLALRVGPLAALLREHPEARDKVMEDVRAALARRLRDGAVYLESATWIVTARNS